MLVYFFNVRDWNRDMIGALDKSELRDKADSAMTMEEFVNAWNDTDSSYQGLEIKGYYIRIE